MRSDGTPLDHSQSCFAPFAVTNPHGSGDVRNEDLAISNLTSACGSRYARNDLIQPFPGDNQFQLDLGQQIDIVFLPAVYLLVSLLPTVATHVRNRCQFVSAPL